jgi:hypothetical protein
MKVREVLSYLKTLDPNLKVTIRVEEQGDILHREVYMIENDCRGRLPRVVFHPGRKAPKK